MGFSYIFQLRRLYSETDYILHFGLDFENEDFANEVHVLSPDVIKSSGWALGSFSQRVYKLMITN